MTSSRLRNATLADARHAPLRVRRRGLTFFIPVHSATVSPQPIIAASTQTAPVVDLLGSRSHLVPSPAVGLIRSVLVFLLLGVLKTLSRIFYRPDMTFIGTTPRDPWGNIRLVAFLNHTSLFEPVFLSGVPARFMWRLAAHGVVPAAEKTTGRPLVGLIFKFVAHHVVSITRERDHTWFEVLNRIDPKSMVIIAPEGRMKRETGLDVNGNPMTVRGGIADILLAVQSGRMLLAYSGGLHHVQIPGQRRVGIFKTVRMRIENIEISDYIAEQMARGGEENFKRNVREDLERRRDAYCPTDPESDAPARPRLDETA